MSKFPQTLPNGDVQDPQEDSELLSELYALLDNHDVPEGLRDTIIDMIARWEMEGV